MWRLAPGKLLKPILEIRYRKGNLSHSLEQPPDRVHRPDSCRLDSISHRRQIRSIQHVSSRRRRPKSEIVRKYVHPAGQHHSLQPRPAALSTSCKPVSLSVSKHHTEACQFWHASFNGSVFGKDLAAYGPFVSVPGHVCGAPRKAFSGRCCG